MRMGRLLTYWVLRLDIALNNFSCDKIHKSGMSRSSVGSKIWRDLPPQRHVSILWRSELNMQCLVSST
jgi:hypothetical protein